MLTNFIDTLEYKSSSFTIGWNWLDLDHILLDKMLTFFRRRTSTCMRSLRCSVDS